jgi:outer membrane protein TolC
MADKSASGLRSLQTVQLDKAREELVVRIAGQYYQLSSTIEKSAMLDFNIRRIGRVAGIVGLQAQEGFARESDHLRLLVRLSLLEAERKKLENAIARQYGYLKLSMGMDTDVPLQIQPVREQEAAFGPDSALVAGLSIEERWLAAQRELLDLEDQRNRLRLYPSLRAFADIRYNAQRSNFNFLTPGDWYQPHVLGMRLAIPVSLLWQSGYDASVTALRRKRLEYGMRQQAQKAALEYASARAELENSREAMLSQQKNVDLSRRLLDEAELKYMEGQLSAIELLEAEALFREAQGVYADSFYAVKTAELQWLRVSGGLLNVFSPEP